MGLLKTFDRFQLKDIVHLLYDRQIPHNLIKTREDIYKPNQIKANGIVVQHKIKFKYLGIELLSYGEIEFEARE